MNRRGLMHAARGLHSQEPFVIVDPNNHPSHRPQVPWHSDSPLIFALRPQYSITESYIQLSEFFSVVGTKRFTTNSTDVCIAKAWCPPDHHFPGRSGVRWFPGTRAFRPSIIDRLPTSSASLSPKSQTPVHRYESVRVHPFVCIPVAPSGI